MGCPLWGMVRGGLRQGVEGSRQEVRASWLGVRNRDDCEGQQSGFAQRGISGNEERAEPSNLQEKRG